MNNDDLRELLIRKVHNLIGEHLCGFRFKKVYDFYHTQKWFSVLDELLLDLAAIESKDPASNGMLKMLVNTSSAFSAIVIYRLSHMLINMDEDHQIYVEAAFKLTEISRQRFGIDIHPRARIGHSLVLDHSYGITIGETSIIGDNCYILGGTIIGARGIASNERRQRHPSIGNNVEVGAYTRILGPINIGDNVIISPYSVITSDINSNSIVRVSNQVQVINSKESIKPFHASAIVNHMNELIVYSKGFNLESCHFIDMNNEVIECIECYIQNTDEEGVHKVDITFDESINIAFHRKPNMFITGSDTSNGTQASLYMLNIYGLYNLLKSKQPSIKDQYVEYA
ncbi:hypothetical protein BIT28_25725 [Photobacterium proteolyticum]|uniref:serine O-acetyltransferase n=1 Tax=Photobacterium proteolyticum TaxID=1903952 RepID=A0A1Q9GFW6_9GAMM|nr:serine O-acetyltransferase [Photobacterium proteolyticum]OLQ73220.1 hypothetical protein BIT28_25725 [Photobacterium proteolyticum]